MSTYASTMDQRPAEAASTPDPDDSLYKREKACLVCSQVFSSAALIKHSWYCLPSKICYHAVCANCSKGTVHDPKTKRQVRACNNCYRDSFVKREDHKQQLIEEHTQLLADLQRQADREREQNRELERKLQAAQDTIRKLEISTRGENLEIMQELQQKLDKKKKKREALQAKLVSEAGELKATEIRIEITQRSMGDVAVQMQEAWEREKEELKARLEALGGRIRGKKGRKESLIRQTEEEKLLQEELNVAKSDLEAKVLAFQGKTQSYLSVKTALSAEIDTLEKQLESLQQELVQYQAKCKEHETSVGGLEELKGTVAALLSETIAFQPKVTHKEAKTNAKLQENSELQGKVRDLEWQLEQKKAHIEDLGLTCRAGEAEETHFTDAKETILEEIQKVKAILGANTEEYNKVKETLEQAEHTSADLNVKIETFIGEQDQGNSHIAHLKASNTEYLSSSLSSELQSLTVDLTSQDQSLLSLQTRLSALETAASRPVGQGKCCSLF